jgi:hypothetical protein
MNRHERNERYENQMNFHKNGFVDFVLPMIVANVAVKYAF